MSNSKKIISILSFTFLLPVMFSFKENIVEAKAGADYSKLEENATLLEKNELDVYLSSSTTTETSASFKLNLASSLQDTFFRDADPNYYIGIDTENSPTYSGKYTDYVDIPDADLETFEAFVHNISNTFQDKYTEVFIPSTLKKAGSFVLNIESIRSEALIDWANIKKVYIPDTIVTIESGAFKNVPDDVVISCMAETQPMGWADDWCDNKSVVLWGQEDGRSSSKINPKSSNTKSFGVAKDFIVGYRQNENYPGEEYNLPLTVKYDVNKLDGSTETRYYEVPHVSKNDYDGVGEISSTLFSVNLDISLNKGEKVDASSLCVYNIFDAAWDSNEMRYYVDLNSKYYAIPRITYKTVSDFSDFFSLTYKGVSRFGEYNVIRLDVMKGPEDVYKKNMTKVYEENEYKLVNGDYKIRYSFQNLDLCTFHCQYIGSNGELKDIDFTIYTPIGSQTINNDKGEELTFMFKEEDIADDFEVANIKFLEVIGLTCQIDLYSSTGTVLFVSKFYKRFGRIELITNETVIKTTSIDLITWLSIAGYTAVYSLCAVLLYFYKKEKYKNDEFKRIKPKKYLKSAIIGYAGSIVALLAVFFCFMRWTIFDSTMVVHNPMDAFVIGFSLVGIVIVGYGIRALVLTIKSEKQRKLRIKLKLNDDTDDDGTK